MFLPLFPLPNTLGGAPFTDGAVTSAGGCGRGEQAKRCIRGLWGCYGAMEVSMRSRGFPWALVMVTTSQPRRWRWRSARGVAKDDLVVISSD
jgi:hypothetical protein